jgi:type VI secretion system protein ImpH
VDASGGTPNFGLNRFMIEQILQDDACSFEFFQAVTLLKRLRPDRQGVGRFSQPDDEAVHFRVNNQLAFPASQIQQIDFERDAPATMQVNFMGLTGPMGVLPYAYTELILERLRNHDQSLPDFLDIFNHRLLSFFYRAWEKYHFDVTYRLGEEDRFTRFLLDFVGMGTPGLQDRQSVPDEAFLHYVALLAKQSRSAVALEAILHDYFEIPVEVEQFAGAWFRLDSETQLCMRDEETESDQLGEGAVVGDEVWDQQSAIRIKLGPMGLVQYFDFLPEGSAYEPLRAITKFFTNGEFDCEVQLVLDRKEAPSCELGYECDGGQRLGWVTWLKSKPLQRDPGDTILHL